MRSTLIALFYYIGDLLAPPRASEYRTRGMTSETLYSLADVQGRLPYRHPRVRALVWELKYRGSPRAARLGGEFLSEELVALREEVLGAPLLIPVPMHPSRRKARGHNQTELLCEAALSHLRTSAPEFQRVFQYEPSALARVRDTRAQQGLPRGKRLTNVKGSMRAAPELVRGRACVVVDDVATTGATLEEARRALMRAGAREVHCLTLATAE